MDIGAAVFQPTQEAVLGFRITYRLPGAIRYLLGQESEIRQSGRWPHRHTGAGKHHQTPVSEGVQEWVREVNAGDLQLMTFGCRTADDGLPLALRL